MSLAAASQPDDRVDRYLRQILRDGREDGRLVALPIADLQVEMSETLICLSRRREARAIRAFMAIAGQAG